MMDATLLERSTLRTKEYSPNYRVEFRDGDGMLVQAWRLTSAIDIDEVLDWARRHESAGRYIVYVEANTPNGLTALRLFDGVASVHR